MLDMYRATALQPVATRGDAIEPIWRSLAAPPHRVSRLTARERQVLLRIADGDSNKHIARAFDLSLHTVKRHVANILAKLGVATRGQAAACWRQQA